MLLHHLDVSRQLARALLRPQQCHQQIVGIKDFSSMRCTRSIARRLVESSALSSSLSSISTSLSLLPPPLMTKVLVSCLPQRRGYVDDVQLPPLCTGDQLEKFPNIFDNFKLMVGIFFVIKPEMDFKIKEFLHGTKQALHLVSHALARENYDSLKDLVYDDVVETLKPKISALSDEQKQLIAVNFESFHMHYLYGIDFIPDSRQDDKRYVEITVITFHFPHIKEDEMPKFEIGQLKDSLQKYYICNYKFIRELSQNPDSQWTISMINHFSSQSPT